jgi:hypothetical protein
MAKDFTANKPMTEAKNFANSNPAAAAKEIAMFSRLTPGIHILDCPHIGFKYMSDAQQNMLLAYVCIPKGATVFCPRDKPYSLRTNCYVIEKIVDYRTKHVSTGFAHVFKMKYDVGTRYIELNVDVTRHNTYLPGLHFFSEVKYAANEVFKTACEYGTLSQVMYWIEQGAYSFSCGLKIACKVGNFKVANLMLQHGVKAKVINDGLDIACQFGHRDIIDLLINYNPKDLDTGLEYACLGAHYDIAVLMIKKGATEVNRGLAAASQSGSLDLADLMITHGADNWNIGLDLATSYGHLAIAKRMIECGATNMNHGLKNACRTQHAELITVMIESGAVKCEYCHQSMTNHLMGLGVQPTNLMGLGVQPNERVVN